MRDYVKEFITWNAYDGFASDITHELYTNPDSDLYYWRRLFSDFLGFSRIISYTKFLGIYKQFLERRF